MQLHPFLSPPASRVVAGGVVFAVALAALLWLPFGGLPGPGPPDSEARSARVAAAVPAWPFEFDGDDARWIGHFFGPAIEAPKPVRLPLRPGAESDEGRISYQDPTDGGVPLEWIAGQSDRPLTPGFTVADFAARDGAAFVRISPNLVDALERVRHRVGSLEILSAYRHPSHNERVGGVEYSRHQAGKAADIRAAGLEPVDLALIAVDEAGCGLGLGLGAESLHLDVRGELVTWAYAGAALEAPAFAVLIRTRCALPVSDSLAQLAREAGLGLDLLEALESETDTSDVTRGADIERYRDLLRATALEALPVHGPGAVVLDLRAETSMGAPYFIAEGEPAIEEWGLERLVEFSASRRTAGYVAFAILVDGRAPHTGILSLREGSREQLEVRER